MTLLTDILKDEVIPAVNAALKKADPSFKTVQFDAGHYAELTARIDKKKNSFQPVVYPLVWLVLDFRQTYDANSIFEYDADRVQLFIVEKSDATSSSLQRIESVFKPVLIPIYEALKAELELSASILNPSLTPVVTLHPYASGLTDKKANLFNDTVDSIEISNLSLQVSQKIIC